MAIRFYRKDDLYGEFSNFSQHGISVEGAWYPTVEHYYQAMKFQDAAYAERIRLAQSPMEAKKLGQTRNVPIRNDWEQVKIKVMHLAVIQKFTSNPKLAELLLSTGNEEIIEASPSDTFWGCGKSNTGENWLGRILMEVRDDLRKNLNSVKTPSSNGG